MDEQRLAELEAENAALRAQIEPQPEPQVAIYLVNAIQTSGGSGPGPVTVPAREAGELVKARLATYGSKPPRDWADLAEEMDRLMAPRRG